MKTGKISGIGESVGEIRTKIRAYMKSQKMDTPHLTETPSDGDRRAAEDPEFVRQMALAEEIMDEDHEVLRALAK